MKLNIFSKYVQSKRRKVVRNVIVFASFFMFLALLLIEIMQPFPVRGVFQPQIQDVRLAVHEEYVKLYYPIYYFSRQFRPIFSIVGDNPDVYRGLIEDFFPKHPFIIEANIKLGDQLYTIIKSDEVLNDTSRSYRVIESSFDTNVAHNITQDLINVPRGKVNINGYFVENNELYIRLFYIIDDDILFSYVVKFDTPKFDEDILDIYAYVVNNSSVIAFPATDLSKPFPKDYTDAITTIAREPNNARRMVRIKQNGKYYLGYKDSFSLEGQTNEIGVVVAERALSIHARAPIVFILILFLAISLSFAIFIVLGYIGIKDLLGNKRSNNIKQFIKEGENTYVEFKASLRYDFASEKVNKNLEVVIMKSIAAFNNTEGGQLIIGVKNDGEIAGLHYDYSTLKSAGRDFFELHLRTLLETNYGNVFSSSDIIVDFVIEDDKDICIVNVKRGREPLYTKVINKQGITEEKFYIRVGNSSRKIAYPSEITSYVKKHFK